MLQGSRHIAQNKPLDRGKNVLGTGAQEQELGKQLGQQCSGVGVGLILGYGLWRMQESEAACSDLNTTTTLYISTTIHNSLLIISHLYLPKSIYKYQQLLFL